VKARLGGLARRATYLEELKNDKVPTLHLDAGDAFQSKYTVTDSDRAQVSAAAEVYLKTFAMMGLQAYTIGDRDLALGLVALRKLARKAKFPFLSANLVTPDQKPIFRPSVVLTVAGKKVAVIGATTTLFVNKATLTKIQGFEITDPSKAVAAEVAKHAAAGVKLFVVLGHLNDSEIEEVAKANPQVQFVLGGQGTRMQRVLSKTGSAWHAGAYFRGKNISVLDAYVLKDSLTFVDRDARKGLTQRKAQLERQIQSRETSITSAKADPKRASTVSYLERNLVQLKTELQEVTLDLEDLQEADPNASYVKWELKGMTTAYSDHVQVAKVVAAYRKVHPDPTKKPKPPRTPPAAPTQSRRAAGPRR